MAREPMAIPDIWSGWTRPWTELMQSWTHTVSRAWGMGGSERLEDLQRTSPSNPPDPWTYWTDLSQSWTRAMNVWAMPSLDSRPADMRPTPGVAASTALDSWRAAWEYWVDAGQRTVLFWDVMRKRGNAFLEHEAAGKPPVLAFTHEMVLDGRTLERPVNYFLVRIVAPPDAKTDPRKRPFMIIDPRAGHGPGIGGFKEDSEIGVALHAGHPCYFVGFRSDPEPGQTLEDVGRAEARFLEEVAALHPEADGRPCVIGNCQAGWAVMMLSAAAPELVGPIVLAGAPLSYWAGSGSQNPMRYAGGLYGGSWLAAMASDLGNGRFDGAHLVANFERLDPANTLWKKPYNLYANVDTEESRYLGFEKWWGGLYLLNEEEMRFIVNNLFVGNRLASADIVTSAGRAIDLRNIRTPIVVFASWGDNITPPQQALNWILDCYASDREILAHEQTIVYILHHDIGHLGIFVSARIAQREHSEIVQTLDVIETLPPGLWEMVIEDKQPDAPHAELTPGRYLVSFERRTLDDIRALEETREDEVPFATVARVSDIVEGLYRTFASPFIRPFVTEHAADTLRRLHPNRFKHVLFSDLNPWMRVVKELADVTRRQRRPVAADNPFLALERESGKQIERTLDSYREARDRMTEQIFTTVYGSPWLQAMVGLRASATGQPRARQRDETFEALLAQKVAALRGRVDQGGPREAIVRMMIYIGGADQRADVRGFRMAERLRDEYVDGERLSGTARRELFKEQYVMLLLDEDRALAALPRLVPTDKERDSTLEAVNRLLSVRGALSPERRSRLARVTALLRPPSPPAAKPAAPPAA